MANVQYPPVEGTWNFQDLSCSYAGLQYHASMALGTQLVLVSGGLNIVA